MGSSAVLLRHPGPHPSLIPPQLRILVAPSGFKECLLPRQVADAMAAGIARVAPEAEILYAPVVDGGEGFTEDVVAALGGTLVPVAVTGPLGEPRTAALGLLGGRRAGTAVLSVASVAGLRLVPPDRRDPLATTSFGIGELIRAALDRGARRILVGCGDSGVHDGGAGMATALGVRLLDAAGRPVPHGGGGLGVLDRIDASGCDRRLAGVEIRAFVNPRVRLVGPGGVTRLYAHQKGADAGGADRLEDGLSRLAAVCLRDLGIALGSRAGAGASGGVGAGLLAFLGGRLVSRETLIDRLSPLPRMLARADLVLTGEGCLDARSADGKVPVAVARRAKRHGLPVFAVAGTLGAGADRVLEHGIDAYVGIIDRPCSLVEAMADAPRLVAEATAQVLRLALAGRRITRRTAAVH